MPETFKCISTYNCVFYYIIVVSDVKYIYLYCHTMGWLPSNLVYMFTANDPLISQTI